jgi:hypothetical protein
MKDSLLWWGTVPPAAALIPKRPIARPRDGKTRTAD